MANYPWHSLAIDLARQGLSRKEVYERIRESYADSKDLAPTCTAVNSYLARNTDLWCKEAKMKKGLKPISADSEKFENLKKFTIKAAKELFYDESYVFQLKHATTEGELTRIMITARERSYED